MSSQRAERLYVDRKFHIAGGDMRQLLVRIAGRTAMPRHMLEAPHDARTVHPVEHRAAERRDLHRFAAQRPVADHIVGFGATDIEGRVKIDRYAHFRKLAAHGLGIDACGLDCGSGSNIPQPGKCLASGIALPFRRFHPGDAATFLVDREYQAIAAMDRAQIVGQLAQLIAVIAIAREQDIARRIGLLEEGAFLGCQVEAGNAENGGRHARHGEANTPAAQARAVWQVWKFSSYLTKQASPSALSAAHSRLAEARSPASACRR